MTLDEFLAQAASHGPCIAIHSETPALVPPAGVELRTIDGAHLKTVKSVFDAFAEAWHFPKWGRNKDALDDFMRDLDNMITTVLRKPPAPGYLTAITNAHVILVEQPDEFPWFAEIIPFYRDYYRDEADPRAAFGVLLSAPVDQLDVVRQRWLDAGAQVAAITS